MATVFLGLGSNLGDPTTQVVSALHQIRNDQRIQLDGVSSLWRTEPQGIADQPWYINSVCRLETACSPVQLLDLTQLLEKQMGRRREGPRFGPRIIDIDLLLYDDLRLNTLRLEIPHPRLHERRFVLEPLAELAPAMIIPGRGPLSELLRQCEMQSVEYAGPVPGFPDPGGSN